MLTLNTTILVLAVLADHNFIIYRLPEVIDAFVCFNEYNDTWPYEWIKLQPQNRDNIPVFETKNISSLSVNNIIKYKLKYMFYNRSFGDSQWKQILNEDATALNNSSSTDDKFLLFLIIGNIIYILMCLTHFILKKKGVLADSSLLYTTDEFSNRVRRS